MQTSPPPWTMSPPPPDLPQVSPKFTACPVLPVFPSVYPPQQLPFSPNPTSCPSPSAFFSPFPNPASSSPPATSDPVPLHDGCCCDGCSNPIRTNIRYKCLQCPNFDLCADCEERQGVLMSLQHTSSLSPPSTAAASALFPASPSPAQQQQQQQQQHDPHTHLLLKLRRPVQQYGGGLCYVLQNRSEVKHAGVRCSACRRDIVGARYLCQVCPSVNLCEGCELSQHHAQLLHPMTKVYVPGTLGLEARTAAQAEQPAFKAPSQPQWASVMAQGGSMWPSHGSGPGPGGSVWPSGPCPPAPGPGPGQALTPWPSSPSPAAPGPGAGVDLGSRVGCRFLRMALQLPGAAAHSVAAAFISPVSVYLALAMALNGAGAGSTTHAQLLQLLTGTDPPQQQQQQQEDALNAQLSLLMRSLSEAGAGATGCTLLLANAVFTGPGCEPRQEFVQLLAGLYQATAKTVLNAADINDWVKHHSRGVIPELLDRGTQFDLVLVNVLYFKGLWETPFERNRTQPRPFYAPGATRNVPMMSVTFKSGPKVESCAGKYLAVELPYEGGQYTAVAVLPEQGVDVADAVDAWSLGAAGKHQSFPPNYTVLLPKFRAESSLLLNEPMRALGVRALFDRDACDLSRMSAQGPLYVTLVLHKTVVDVDELGTVAVAATAVATCFGASAPQPPTLIVFDRPFGFIIRHNASGTPIFMGAVVSPPASS